MKKLILFIFLTSLTLTSKGQINTGVFDENAETVKKNQTDERPYVIGQKRTAVEIGFNPQNIFGNADSGDIFGFINNMLIMRFFNGEGKATRIGANVSYVTRNEIIQQADIENDIPELRAKYSAYALYFMPGFETHYGNNPKVSPYTGFQFLIGITGNRQEVEAEDENRIVSVALVNDPEAGGYGAFNIGGGFMTGVDYYIASRLYIGAEVGIGVQYSKFLPTKVIDNVNRQTSTYENGNQFMLSPYLTSASVRLGWTF